MDSSRADDLVKQAEKKLASFSFFGLKSADKYEAAAALLEKAGTQYKLAKKCKLPACVWLMCPVLHKAVCVSRQGVPQSAASLTQPDLSRG